VFAEEIEFEHEIETTEPLLFVLRRFLEQLSLRLGALYLVAQEIRLRLTFSNPPKDDRFAAANKSHYEHVFHIPDPTRSVEILFRLLQAHLESFRAEHPIVAVGLEAQPARPARQQFQLFETPLRDPTRLHETLTRLTGLFGKERVGTPVLEDSHRPDAFRLEPFVWELPASLPNDSCSIMGPALRRLRAEFLPKPDAPVLTRQGPYLASGNWWNENHWQRAEWDLELESGMVCRCQERRDESEIEGIYD
jgi:protein ImuB